MRAGREVSEDVVRRITAACKAAGLRIDKRQYALLRDKKARFICVCASDKDWSWDTSMVEVHGRVDLSGNVGNLRILTSATRNEPVEQVWNSPVVRDAVCELESLPALLRVILREREAVIQMMAEGMRPPFQGLQWTWEPPAFA